MEASVSTDGATQDAGAEQGQEQTQEAPQQQVPTEVMERLDELSGKFDNLEPLLPVLQEALQQPQEEEGEPGYGQYFDDETGEFDPQAFDQQVEQRAKQIAQDQMGPLQQQLQQVQDRMLEDEFAALADDYPQLTEQTFMQQFVPELKQNADQLARELGLPQEMADQLVRNPNFIEREYLARQAMAQAQQGAPAGDQGVHLEGGSGNPGQPQKDDTLDRWDRDIQQNLGSGPWGRNLLSG